MTCRACEIEAEIGTAEVPHPVDARLHVCTNLNPTTRRAMATYHLRAAAAMLEEDIPNCRSLLRSPHNP